MFGKKTPELPPQQPIVNTPTDYIEVDELNPQQPTNPLTLPQQPVQQPPIHQPVQQQPIQSQIPKEQARILKGETTESGTFVYIVEANYPLSLGNCSLANI